MQIYNPSKTRITLNGIVHTADENGVIDVPDTQMNSSVWTQGFVCATAHLAQLAKAQAEAVATATPEPTPAPAKAAVTAKAEPKTTTPAGN